jgi:hypothetical protein
MKKYEEVARLAKESIESLSAKVVDVSTYPATKAFSGSPFDVVIIAAYIPGKACLMTIDVNVKRSNSNLSDMKFTINGEFNEQGWEKYCQDGGYILVDRSSVGSESYGGRQFSINDYTAYKGDTGTIDGNIKRGMNFFKEFLDKYGEMLAASFSHSVHLWYVPEYSDALVNNEEKNGSYNDQNYTEFNAKVLAKFPEGIFSAGQSV